MREGKGQGARVDVLTDRLEHAERQGCEVIRLRQRRLSFKELGIKETRQQRIVGRADISQCPPCFERQHGGFPIPAARQAENASGKGGAEIRCCFECFALRILVSQKQCRIEHPTKYTRVAGTGMYQECFGLIQSADRQKPINTS